MNANIYGPNTAIVEAFIERLGTFRPDDPLTICARDPGKRLASSAPVAEWFRVYADVAETIDRVGRGEFLQPAWWAVQLACKPGPLMFSALPVLEALLVWDGLTDEERKVMWSAFRGFAVMPKTAGGPS